MHYEFMKKIIVFHNSKAVFTREAKEPNEHLTINRKVDYHSIEFDSSIRNGIAPARALL